MINSFDGYDYVIVDCPPNKMSLTQAMLRACTYFIPVTIPDMISVYGMPRLLRWVRNIPRGDQPLLLGYILNAVNRTGGHPSGKVKSQQSAEAVLQQRIQASLEGVERDVAGKNPCLGIVPRLDVIARFLAERGAKLSKFEFYGSNSRQAPVYECISEIIGQLVKRMDDYRAKA